MPLFQIRLFILYQAPHSQALAPTCCALFLVFNLSLNNPLLSQPIGRGHLNTLWEKDKMLVAIVARRQALIFDLDLHVNLSGVNTVALESVESTLLYLRQRESGSMEIAHGVCMFYENVLKIGGLYDF